MGNFSRFLATAWLVAVTLVAAQAADIAIVSPRDGETVHDNAGNLTVTAALAAGELEPGQRIRFLLDGEPMAPDAAARSAAVGNVDRGTHTLQALLLDKGGRVIGKSAQTTFYLWQASRNFPSRQSR